MYEDDRLIALRRINVLSERMLKSHNPEQNRQERLVEMITVLGALGSAIELKDRVSQKDMCCKLAALCIDYATRM